MAQGPILEVSAEIGALLAFPGLREVVLADVHVLLRREKRIGCCALADGHRLGGGAADIRMDDAAIEVAINAALLAQLNG